MLAYAEYAFRMGERQPDGATALQHFESIYRQSGSMPEPLRIFYQMQQDLPEPVIYLWEWFNSLSQRREYNDGVPQVLSTVELTAWASTRGLTISPWEAEVLERLESAFINFALVRRAAEYDKQRRKFKGTAK